jgi:hypothetical protein
MGRILHTKPPIVDDPYQLKKTISGTDILRVIKRNIMKPTLKIITVALCIFLSTAVQAGHQGVVRAPVSLAESARLESRLVELKSMDRSSMTRQQRHDRREEVKSIRRATSTGGVYISVGGLLLIIILLIILL